MYSKIKLFKFHDTVGVGINVNLSTSKKGESRIFLEIFKSMDKKTNWLHIHLFKVI